jgi:hypothetical protein
VRVLIVQVLRERKWSRSYQSIQSFNDCLVSVNGGRL